MVANLIVHSVFGLVYIIWTKYRTESSSLKAMVKKLAVKTKTLQHLPHLKRRGTYGGEERQERMEE